MRTVYQGKPPNGWRALLAALLLPLAGMGATRAAEPPDPRGEGTIRMAALLKRLAQEQDPMENPFLSRQRAELIGKKIEGEQDPKAKNALRYSYGMELLNAGMNEMALAQFDLVLKEGKDDPLVNHPNNRLNIGLNRALCHLRIAEQRNCLENHTSESCIMPIQGEGIHKHPEGSRAAIKVLEPLLDEFPDNLAARWLLNLAFMTLGEYPGEVPGRWLVPPEVFASDYDIKRFVDVAGPAGLDENSLSGGSIVEDFDGDGFLDVMVTSIGLEDQMRYFRNNGDGTFTDRTIEAGLEGLTGGLNMVSGDYNNDGLIDVLVLRGGWMADAGKFPNSLLRNLGGGKFEDVTEQAGMLSFAPTQTAVWFDFDGDGWLDIFIGNETSRSGSRYPCELYRNNGDGTFTEMAAKAGVDLRTFVKGVATGDFNNDGRPDLYLSMIRRGNILLRNDGPAEGGGWKLTDVTGQAGVSRPTSSFPTFFFDYDNDGWEDIFVAGYTIANVGDIVADYLGQRSGGQRAKLYRNRGDGTFEDVTEAMGLDRVLHSMGINYGDLDNDGWLDFYLGTGDPDLVTIIPNRMFRNDAGRRFQDVTTSGGFGNIQKGHGISFADIDNDGNQDVHHDMGGASSGDIYPNVLFLNPGHGNRWIKISLHGVKANRPGIGARLKFELDTPAGSRTIYRTMSTGGSFGGNPLRLEVGLGDAAGVRELEIRWPGSGTVQRLRNLKVDSWYVIREDRDQPELKPVTSFAWPEAGHARSGAHHHH